MADVILKVGADLHAGWTRVAIRRSIQLGADQFELTLTDRWDSGQEARPVALGAAVDVLIGGERVIRGAIDDVEPSYDAETHTVVVRGRSRPADLVDCSGLALRWRGRTLLQIAQEVCEPFGIGVRVAAGVDVGGPFNDVGISPGQTYWEFLEWLARVRALLLVSDPDGNLVLTRAGTGRAPTALVLGENIRQARGEFSLRDRYQTYYVQGQQPANPFGDPTVAAEAAGMSVDNRPEFRGRHRPVLVPAEDAVTVADCQRRAEWERNVRFGRSLGTVYTVAGWLHGDGRTWAPNLLVPVRDPWLGIDGDRLIVGVQLLLDDDGDRTELQLMPPEAFELTPLPEIKGTLRGWTVPNAAD